MDTTAFLRVQNISHAELDTENQRGPISFHLLTVTVSPLFPPQGQVLQAQELQLALDESQLAALKAWLLQRELQATPDRSPPTVQ